MMPGDDTRAEKYACDACRSKKVACTREHSGCRRCRRTGARCTYSRSGTISRKRKRKNRNRDQLHAQCQLDSGPATVGGSSSGADSHLAADIEATRERLDRLNTPERQSFLEALSSLSETCSRKDIRPETLRLGVATGYFSRFEQHSSEWTEVFENFLRKRAPLMLTPHPDVMHYLRAARPNKVCERAWLVMYYGIILNTGILPSLKEKLQQNLWLALSDVDVLLRPSEVNLQAILLVLGQVSEMAGPSLCWMLASSASRMLQTLGMDVHLLDQQTRERRVMQFWHLNLLDKGLAIIFAKAPTFHHEEAKEIELPTLEQIQPPRAHLVANGTSGFFGAHYVYHKFLLSRLMADIWYCIYGKAAPNCAGTEAALNNLVSWYDQARKILDAAALSEKPFCDAQNAKSIDVALHTIEFHFIHLKILLTRSAACMQDTCLDASIRMLHLLQDMAPESTEPYHPILWQLVCCPFTPLLILFRDILFNNTTARRSLDRKKRALAAMEQLPIFLQGISSRSSLATKLERIASLFVQHARSVISRLDAAVIPEAETITVRPPAGDPPLNALEYNSSGVLDSDLLDWNSFHARAAASVSPVSTTQLENDFAIFMRNVDSDGTLDWLNLEASAAT